MYIEVKNKWQHDYKLRIFSSFSTKYRAAVISQCTAVLIHHILCDASYCAAHVSGRLEELRAVSGLCPCHAYQTGEMPPARVCSLVGSDFAGREATLAVCTE